MDLPGARLARARGPRVVLSGPAALGSPQNVLEVRDLGPHHRPTESEILDVGCSSQCAREPVGDSCALRCLRTAVLKHGMPRAGGSQHVRTGVRGLMMEGPTKNNMIWDSV